MIGKLEKSTDLISHQVIGKKKENCALPTKRTEKTTERN